MSDEMEYLTASKNENYHKFDNESKRKECIH